MLRQHMREGHTNVVANLRHEDDAAHLLHLLVIGRRDTVHIARDLRAEITDADELGENILRQYVRVARLANVIRAHVDMVGTQVEVGSRDGAHAPVGLRAESLLFVLRGCRHNHLLAVHVGGGGGHCGKLALLARLLLDLGNLLTLQRGRSNLHAEDDVAHFGLCERSHVHVVLLSVVGEDQVLERNLHLDPLFVGQRWPDVVRLGHHRLIRPQDHLGAILRHVERAKDEDEARKGRVARDGLEPIVVNVEEHHLRLGRLEDQVAELLDLQASLER
mmetsp:Transcript_63487/g.174936  ORF Transcript_63487/g.174936 Transcript_63487/m.174936 type:complete len:276 (-) Transcript_63487:4603-5430(-)